MNITNIRLVLMFSEYETWRFLLDGKEHIYNTMSASWLPGSGDTSYAEVCVPKGQLGRTRIAVVHEFMPLGTKPKEALERFYKLAMLQ